MGDSAKVRMGACTVSFNGEDLGYTKGNVSVSYSTESQPKEVDQEDTPVDEIITKQTFEAKVPLAEYDLDRFAALLPGATVTKDGEKVRMDLSGSAGGSLVEKAAELKIHPIGGGANDAVTLHHAVPVPNLEYAYERDGQRVFEITFKALKGTKGFVTFGDTTVVAA